jgi:hypothetical protein
MTSLSYAQAVTRNTFDPRLMLLDPMMAEVTDGYEEELRQGQELLSNTIAAQIGDGAVDPTKGHQGEKLPDGTSRNFAGLLLKNASREIQVDENLVEAEITRLRSRLLIGCFVGRKPSALEFEEWLVGLNAKLEGGSVCFSHYEGKGFFSLEADSGETQKKILSATPQKLKGMCVFITTVDARFRIDKASGGFCAYLGHFAETPKGVPELCFWHCRAVRNPNW